MAESLPPGPENEARARAVALSYKEGDAAPRVVAKGYGVLAETLLRTAREHGLYIHESPELVSLLMQVDMDSRIPPSLYVAVAELLAWLYCLDQQAPAPPPALADRVAAARSFQNTENL